jgi:hypothetical protein
MLVPPMAIFDMPFFQKRPKDITYDTVDQNSEVLLIALIYLPNREIPHYAAGFLEKCVKGIQTLNIKLTIVITAIRIALFPRDRYPC